ncbi:hypothetical protein [Sphingomonas pseudosanguinis]|uniref:Uncharacterized protein n=1 Tax=Sphingomonas pseudosanguinis TaxID=413712 RepID=A0A7W6F1S4_9SPHN|nr:hypothetical protein [Sphingomonas pseudosanguinis]MBB3878083.1 hypothetical protein [Sphingomonas pseudosanguinis]MBN3537953.1 hypothetical protein [Sphingomonas pseudosanguinis]
MAGALLEIWLTVSALSSLLIVLVAIGHSDLRLERRLKTRPDRVRAGTPRRRRRQTRRV